MGESGRKQAPALPARGTARGMALGGEAVFALEDGPVVFVPRGAPGDVAELAVDGSTRGVLRGRLARLERPGPGRVEPPCPFFRAGCGGCQWQQLDDATQLEQKQTLLGETLRRLGKLEAVPLLAPVAAAEPWHYRASLQVHLAADGQVAFAAAHSHDLVPIDHCPIAHPLLNRAIAALAAPLARAILRDAVAAVGGIGLRVASAGGEDRLLMVLQSAGGRTRYARRLVAEVQQQVPELASAWFLDSEAAGRKGAVARPELLAGQPALPHEVGGERFYIGPQAFFQVNTAQAAHLVGLVRQALRAARPRTVLDLYCGVGLFALSIRDLAEQVMGLDSEEEAVLLAQRALEERPDGGAEVSFYRAEAEETPEGILAGSDAVLLDPPRSGLSAALLDRLIANPAPLLIYVSCEPSTLARDLRRLSGAGWRLESVQLIDLFPQTYHIESVSVLKRPLS